jgi:putative flippase GtrA
MNFLDSIFHNKLIRFFLVGGLNAAFGYGLFAFLIFIGLSYPLALFLGTIVGILFNFKTIGTLVFKNHNNVLIFKFFAVYGITYLFNLIGLTIFKYFAVNIYLGGAILLIPIGILAFNLNKIFVFKNGGITK